MRNAKSEDHKLSGIPRLDSVSNSYDQVAEEYVTHIAGELDHKPIDRELLDRFAARFEPDDLVCDIGCGPGHVARYLHEQGVKVTGIDLSPGMVEQARRLNPDIEFRVGNMLALDVEDSMLAGIIAFYSIIHIPRSDVVRALRELRRALRPGGLLLISFHIGDEILHLDELWDQPVSLDFIFFQPGEMRGYLITAGFEIEEVVEREPYPEVEYQSRRAYVLARNRAPTEERDP